ncbi:MAG TPA: endolytic transglycosylase MltG [Candidatus Saccharimonadales bacterium]|nr:endolytic transglycosylase MltG [Candidatus Saccharimonadales bacterium]
MKYTVRPQKRSYPKRLFIISAVLVVGIVVATIFAQRTYHRYLGPLNPSDQQVQLVTVEPGGSVDSIARLLQSKGIIRSAWAFELYVSAQRVRTGLEAGTYRLSTSEGVEEIVSQLSHGKIATNLVTILPGQRLDQLEQTFIDDGYSASAVGAAFNDPSLYKSEPIMALRPDGASLEGLLYPDSFQKTDTTTMQQIVQESLAEMNQKLTSSWRAALTGEGLSPYQGLVLASMVEQEAANQADRDQVAQVFLSRLHASMPLGSDVTAYYGDHVAGQSPSLTLDTPYNTLIHTGLPPTPISTVSSSSLQAVAYPSHTNWLYFVTGDDGVTHFSQTLAEHQQLTQQYCHKLCSGD